MKLILVHGRGASAADIASLAPELGWKGEVAAPQAPGRTWYPHSFLAPIEANQPYLDRSLAQLDALAQTDEPVALLGFSQGACLVLEYVARHPRRYAAVMGLTGGLIRPVPSPGSLEGTPVFLGSGDPDPHVPYSRVQETAAVLERMGATVEMRRYPGLPHTINQDELDACRALLKEIA